MKAQHFSAIHFVIISQEMKNPVNQEPPDLIFTRGPVLPGLLFRRCRRQNNFPQKLHALNILPAIREAQHIRGIVLSAIFPIQPADGARPDEYDADLAARPPEQAENLRTELRNRCGRNLRLPLPV